MATLAEVDRTPGAFEIRRASWMPGAQWHRNTAEMQYYRQDGAPVHITSDDLQATDWEVVSSHRPQLSYACTRGNHDQCPLQLTTLTCECVCPCHKKPRSTDEEIAQVEEWKVRKVNGGLSACQPNSDHYIFIDRLPHDPRWLTFGYYSPEDGYIRYSQAFRGHWAYNEFFVETDDKKQAITIVPPSFALMRKKA